MKAMPQSSERVHPGLASLGVFFKRFGKSRLSLASAVFFVVESALLILLPEALKLDPYTSHPGYFSAGPEPGHIFGFDDVGRDLFARNICGGRTSLAVGFFSTLISLLIGLPLGLLAGYYRGIWETIIMRVADIFMAFPAIVLILVIVSITGPSIYVLIFIMGLLRWTSFARLLHGKILSVREEEYIEAARAIGTQDRVIITKYVLPNVIGPVIVQTAFVFSSGMILEAGLSFLGMGIRPPMASWGNILYAAQSIAVLSRRPWVWLPAGMLFVITVLSVNFTGDGLRKVFDPKTVK
jgi:peptide/nickel transport system permease protein